MALPVESAGEITSHLTTGAVVVYLIEWLKKQRWATAVTNQSSAVNRIISFGGAVIGVMGITFAYDPMVGGDVHIPALPILFAGAWEVIKQFALQQVLFDAAIKPRAMVVDARPEPLKRDAAAANRSADG